MSSLPTTLEDLQYQILQGDLTANPKLQASSIPARDKALKTTAKKIIPAINELLSLLESCKESVETYSSGVEEKVRAVTTELEDTLKVNQLEALNTAVSEMQIKVNQLVAESMTQQLDELKTLVANTVKDELINTGTGAGGTEMKRVFHSKVVGNSITAPFKIQEVVDLEKQIEVFHYSQRNKKYIKITPTSTHQSNSVYAIYEEPYTILSKVETDEIIITSTLGTTDDSIAPLLIYFYTME